MSDYNVEKRSPVIEVQPEKDGRYTLQEAEVAMQKEQSMSFMTAIKTHPKAVAWSLLISTAVIMDGFDSGLVGSFFGFPVFQKKFGHHTKNDGYQLSAAWQSGLKDAGSVGEILGLFLNAWASERFGYRKTMACALTCSIGFIFMAFFAQNLATLLAYEIIMGIPWGVFQTLTTSYAAEVCPVALRPYLTIWVNMCWHLGGLLSNGVLRALLRRKDEWGYRIPFALQWMWPVPLIIGCILAPESPWWLVRKGKIAEADKAIRRLTSYDQNEEDEKVEETLSMMIHTHELELQTTTGAHIWDCFKGIDLRRTEVVCITYAIQNISQSPLNGAYFFEQAGLPATDSFDLTMGQMAAEIVGTIMAWFCLPWFGRRFLYLLGLAVIIVISFIMGGIGLLTNSAAQWTAGGLVIANYLIYSITIGSLVYSLVPELSTNRLRTKQMALARNLYNVVGIINGVLVPHMVNKTAWGWGAKAAFFYGGWQIIAFVWCFFRLPEPRGRTYAELDLLFSMGTPAREFSSTKVDPFAAEAEILATNAQGRNVAVPM